MGHDSQPPITLTKSTRIPIGLAVAAILAAVSGTYYISTQINDLKNEVRAARPSWTLNQMQNWAYSFDQANRDKNLRIPNPADFTPAVKVGRKFGDE